MYRKISLVLIIMIASSFLLTGCKYNFPEDSKKEPHTYEEALAYIQNYLNRYDITLSEETSSGETEFGERYVNYFANVDGISFIVSSQERCHYDQTGEFCKLRFNLYNNFNYEKIHSLFQDNQYYQNFELKLENKAYLNIYNITYFNYIGVVSNEEELVTAFEESKGMYEWMISQYPNPRYCVIINFENPTRQIYICAHKSDANDVNFGFNKASFAKVMDEYRSFYE